jgi:hypothetical protein
MASQSDAEIIRALRAENELLKKQLKLSQKKKRQNDDDYDDYEEEPVRPQKTIKGSATKKTPAKNTAKENQKMSKALFALVKRAVKKEKHNDKKKPKIPEVSAVWPKSVWDDLLGALPVDSDSAMMIKVTVPPGYAVRVLGWDALIHPVKFDGKVWCAPGHYPSIYAIASYDSIEFKYKKKDGMVSAKVRTYMAGSGNKDSMGDFEAQMREQLIAAENEY